MQLKLRGLGVALTALVLSTATLGCPLLKSKRDDQSSTDPVPAPTAVSVTGAKNEAQITRFGSSETPLGNVQAMIFKDTTVRASPNGAQIATLGRGTSVAKVSQFSSSATLIQFNDQSGDGSTLLGWVPINSFDPAPVPANVKPIVSTKAVDGGSTPAPTTKDAGAPTPSPAKVDAGPPAPAPAPVPVNPNCPVACAATPDGRCPTGKTNDNGMCRQPCKADADCPRNTKCGSKKLCTSG